ncbi:hypothetical protein [Tateyamaria sp. SN3-11]|uniref:hypothetical protein n=1 Tax=Tateyamaria sp. SN3-11 TaxID=3092147 RepID=UPI0039EB8FC4
MAPRVTVLQLDTEFPRIPGDVGCPETYVGAVDIIRIPGATVGHVVSDRPDLIDIVPFERAVRAAQGDVIVTSCGFLSYWQDHLAELTPKPFISSALTALDRLRVTAAPGQVLILTFDAARLRLIHLGAHGAYACGVVGLPGSMHLRQVIEHNQATLDTARAEAELVALLKAQQLGAHTHLLLECTNLPPYKAALHAVSKLPVSDILTEIESVCPGAVRDPFLAGFRGR